jgi:hypothetical protein
MTVEGHIKSVLGELIFNVASLTAQLEAALQKCADLEAKIKELENVPEE